MRNLLLTIFISLFSFSLTAQGCLPEGINFSTQEQIDNFQSDYPDCTEIEGYVVISGNDITILTGLNSLTAIGGDFVLYNNPLIEDLSGLENIFLIGGSLSIINNDTMISLGGLSNVINIGSALEISGNNSLNNISALQSVYSIGDHVKIRGNLSLVSLSGLNNISSIGGDLELWYNYSLQNLMGLENLNTVDGSFTIELNQTILNLNGLNNLHTINGELKIHQNENLVELTGLDNLNSVENLSIGFNYELISLIGLSHLSIIEGNLSIYNNNLLIGLTGLDNISHESINDIFFAYNNNLTMCEIQSICDYLISPNGIVQIFDNATGCNSQEEVEEACEAVSIDEFSAMSTIITSPNPFSTSTTFSYELKEPSTVQFSVFNQLGQLVYQHTEDQQQGSQLLQWDAQGQAGGLYYYQMQVGNQQETGKILKVY